MNNLPSTIGTWEIIGPEKAAEYLKSNINNRPLGMHVVKNYAYQMKNGEWLPDVIDAIAFDTRGRLRNGQHRLQAVIMSGVSIPFLVQRNVPDTYFDYVDTGKARMVSDIINIPDPKTVAPGARVIAAFKAGATSLSSAARGRLDGTHTELSNRTIKAEVEENPSFYTEMASIVRRVYNRTRLVSKRSLMIVACVANFCDRGEKINEFVEELATNDEGNRTVIRFQKYLFQQKAGDSPATRDNDVRVLLYAYDCYRTGKELKQFKKASIDIVQKEYETLAVLKVQKLREEVDA